MIEKIKKIGVLFALCSLFVLLGIFQPKNIIRNRINRKFSNDIISLSDVMINNSSKITFRLQTKSCQPMDAEDGMALSEFINCVSNDEDVIKFDEVMILLDSYPKSCYPTLLSIKMKNNNGGLYIFEFNCNYTEIYTDVLSCFDLSKTEKIIYRGEAIVDYKNTFSQMNELKKLSIFCKQTTILSTDIDDLISSMPCLERLDLYVTFEIDYENWDFIRNKYPNVTIGVHPVHLYDV